MEPEFKEKVEGLAKAFEAFKQSNDAELAEIKKRGAADVVTAEKTERINNEVTRLNDAVEQIKTAMARSGGTEAEAKKDDGAFGVYLRKGDQGLVAKAMSVVSDPDGGYMVPTERSNEIVKKIYDLSPIRQIASSMQIGKDAVELLVDNGDITAAFVGELEQRTETTSPQIARVNIPAHEMYARLYVTQKLLEDADLNVEAWLAEKVADSFARAEADKFINGSGAGEPRGFTTYTAVATADGSRTWGQLEYVISNGSGAFDSTTPSDRIFNIIYALKAAYRNGASFVMPKEVALLVRKFKETTTNAYIWQPGLQLGQPQSLAGYPLIEAENMPTLAANSYSLAFGNFAAGYKIVDRVGISTLRDPFSRGDYGQVVFNTRKRVGGAVVNFDAIKLMKFGTS